MIRSLTRFSGFLLMSLFFIGFQPSHVQAQVYTLGNTTTVGGWYQLGTLNLGQNGYDATIRISAGKGYNATNAQIGDCVIRIRTSNAVDNDNGFYAAAHYYNIGYTRLANAVKIEQVDLSNWRIYVQLPSYTGFGARLQVEVASGSWSHNFVPTTTPAGKDIIEKYLMASPTEATYTLKANRLFAGNANVTTNSRNSINSFNVGSDAALATGWIAADFGGTDNSNRLVIGTGYGGKPVIGTMNGDLTVAGSSPLLINPNGGNVGIGTLNPTEKLSVDGSIRTRKLIVTQTGWGDYVFDSAYQLPSLEALGRYVKENKHLPDIPPASVVETEGADVGEIQKQLVKKMEEMTLYMIEQDRRLKLQEARIQQLEQQLKKKK